MVLTQDKGAERARRDLLLLLLFGVRDDGRYCKGESRLSGFFALRKDADPDVPILKEAPAEYAKLK